MSTKAKTGDVIPAQQPVATLIPASRHPFFKSRARLGTLRGIRRELASLYAACKCGAVDASDGAKLAFILRSTAATLCEGELEQRVKLLEQSDANSPNSFLEVQHERNT